MQVPTRGLASCTASTPAATATVVGATLAAQKVQQLHAWMVFLCGLGRCHSLLSADAVGGVVPADMCSLNLWLSIDAGWLGDRVAARGWVHALGQGMQHTWRRQGSSTVPGDSVAAHQQRRRTCSSHIGMCASACARYSSRQHHQVSSHPGRCSGVRGGALGSLCSMGRCAAVVCAGVMHILHRHVSGPCVVRCCVCSVRGVGRGQSMLTCTCLSSPAHRPGSLGLQVTQQQTMHACNAAAWRAALVDPPHHVHMQYSCAGGSPTRWCWGAQQADACVCSPCRILPLRTAWQVVHGCGLRGSEAVLQAPTVGNESGGDIAVGGAGMPTQGLSCAQQARACNLLLFHARTGGCAHALCQPQRSV
jgi:hypothetical protein